MKERENGIGKRYVTLKTPLPPPLPSHCQNWLSNLIRLALSVKDDEMEVK